MDKDRCYNCYYWQHKVGQLNPRIGYCRRYPPKKEGNWNYITDSGFPLMSEYIWCGEHWPKEKGQPPPSIRRIRED